MATNNAINTDTNSFCKTANNLSDVATAATARLNLFVPLSVSSATVLPATAYGKEVICTGSAAYALTLPTVTSNANKFIDIFSQTTSNALVTITPASGTIAGQSTLVIGSGDGVRVMNDGTNWWVLNCWLQPTRFVVLLSAPQSIANNTATKVQYNSVVANVGGFYDNSVNFRYTPKLPGIYNFSNQLSYATTATANCEQHSRLYTNGSPLCFTVLRAVANTSISITSSATIDMNGSTSYVEAYGYQVSGGNLNVLDSASTATFGFWGSRVSLF